MLKNLYTFNLLKSINLFLLIFTLNQTKEEYSHILTFPSIYPSGFTLNNGNNLIAAQYGLYLYDQSSSQIKTILNFTTGEDMITTEEDCIKTTFTQLLNQDGGYVLCLIKDILYIFSPNIELIDNFNLKEKINGYFYSLIHYKNENDNIDYIIVVTEKINDNYYLHIVYYKMNLKNKTNEMYNNKTIVRRSSNGIILSDFSRAVCCVKMEKSNIGQILVCFHENRNSNEIGISFFDLNNLEEISSLSPLYLNLTGLILNLRAAVSGDKSKAFVCYLYQDYDKGAYCFFYNINSNTYTEPIRYSNGCRIALYCMGAYYCSQSDQFLFFCADNTANYNFALFESNQNIIIKTEKENISNCHGYKAISIIFLSSILHYSILIDCSENFTSLYSIEQISKNITINNSLYNLLSPSLISSTHLFSSVMSSSTLYNSYSSQKTSIISSTLYHSYSSQKTSIISSNLYHSYFSPKTSIISSTLYNSYFSPKTSIISSTLYNSYSSPKTSIISSNLYHSSLKTSIMSSTLVLTSSSLQKLISSYPNILKTTDISKSTFISTILLSSQNKLFSSILKSSSLINSSSNNLISSYPKLISSLLMSTSLIKSSFPNILCEKYLYYDNNECLNNIPEGFYLFDENKRMIKKCHESCKLCIKGPNQISNNCQKCKNNNHFIEEGNCVDKCSYNYISNNNNMICEPKLEDEYLCPENKPYKYKDNITCVKSCDINELLEKKCEINRVTDESLKVFNDQIDGIILNYSICNETNIFIWGNDILFHITTTDNIKNNKYNNISSINLGECEKNIKEEYKIDYIIIKKIDIKVNENIIVFYELYNPVTKNKINLSICKNNKIEILTPIDIDDKLNNNYKELSNEGYNIFDPNDPFYNDVCSPYISENDTDIILLDRKKIFFNDNLTYCQSDCSFKGIDIETNKVKCECNVIENQNYKISSVKFDKVELVESFYQFNNFTNFKVITCFDLVFSKKGQIYNIGSYLLILFTFIFLIIQIKYIINQKMYVGKLIRELLNSMNIKISNILGIPFELKNIPPKKKVKKRSKSFISKETKNNNQSSTKIKLNNLNININATINKLSLLKKRNKSIDIYRKRILNKKRNVKNIIYDNNYNYNDGELNSLTYDQALIYDKRSPKEYYFSLLMKKHLILFTFLSKNDYNLKTIKYGLFIISVSLYITINSFFFIDENMHKIYIDHGIFNYIYQIPQIIYSFFISIFCNLIINYLVLSEKSLLKVKKCKIKFEVYNKSVNLFKYLRIKFNLFFIIGFLYLSFCWYFISAFCAVYKNTQNIYLKNCLLSFSITIIYPFILNIIPVILRTFSLKSNNRKCLYILSSIFSII